MKLMDALFNWLQIEVVAKARPDDRSARDTADFFRSILAEDHGVAELTYEKDTTMYHLRYTTAGEEKVQPFPNEAVHALLDAITNEPKFNQ